VPAGLFRMSDLSFIWTAIVPLKVVALSALFALPVKNIGRKVANAKPLDDRKQRTED